MKTIEETIAELISGVRKYIVFREETPLRYIVENPYYFNDGDGLFIVLKHTEKIDWIFTDEAHTQFHINNIFSEGLPHNEHYHIVQRMALRYGITEIRGGEFISQLKLPPRTENTPPLETLEDFIRGLLYYIDIADYIYQTRTVPH